MSRPHLSGSPHAQRGIAQGAHSMCEPVAHCIHHCIGAGWSLHPIVHCMRYATWLSNSPQCLWGLQWHQLCIDRCSAMHCTCRSIVTHRLIWHHTMKWTATVYTLRLAMQCSWRYIAADTALLFGSRVYATGVWPSRFMFIVTHSVAHVCASLCQPSCWFKVACWSWCWNLNFHVQNIVKIIFSSEN